MNAIKFSMPVIFVKDISASRKFYQEIFSLEIENDFGENVAFRDSFSIWKKGRAEEIIFGSERSEKDEISKDVELYFESSEIETVSEKVNDLKIDLIHGIREEPWGQRTIRFYDPDKFIIEVAEPMDDVIVRLSKLGVSKVEVSKKTQMSLDYIEKVIQIARATDEYLVLNSIR